MRSALACFGMVTSLALASGCSAILGVEDLHRVSDGGAAPGSSAPDAGAAAGQDAGSVPANDAGAASSDGSLPASSDGAVAAGGDAGSPAPGGGSDAGAPAADAGGDAGAPVGTSGAVHGRVIDFRRSPVPDVAVRIGATVVRTDAEGRFTVEAVPGTYDVTISIRAPEFSGFQRSAWQVQGLTRRDPTLQVYRALSIRSQNVVFQTSSSGGALTATQRIAATWASPQGEYQTERETLGSVSTSVTWVGAASSIGNAHALLYEQGGTPELPTRYLAHDTHPITLQDSAPEAPIDFSLSPQTIPSETLTGTVTGANQNRALYVFARFADNTALALPSVYDVGDSFSYVVPKLVGVNFTVLLQNSINGSFQGRSLAYADSVIAGQTPVALTLPPMPELIAPSPGKLNVSADTLFQWSGSAKVFVLCTDADKFYERACVVTGKSETRLPLAPVSDYVPSAGETFSWFVETHGDFASVDEASSEAGFLTPGYAGDSMPALPRGPGRYASSESWGYTSAP